MQPQEDGFQNYDLMGVVFISYIYVFSSGYILMGWRTGESDGRDRVADEGSLYIFLGWRHRYPSAYSTLAERIFDNCTKEKDFIC